MKKRLLGLVVGCMLCGMLTGCGSSVNAEPGDVVTEANTNATVSNVQFATGVSTEAAAVAEADLFDATLDLTNLKTVSIMGVSDSEEDADNEFMIQVYADAQKKLKEFSFAYEYEFEGGEYEVEVGENFRKNVSLENCEWMHSYSEISSYIDGTKFSKDKVSIDCSMFNAYEMVYVHIEDSEYGKNETLVEDRYYIKENATGNLSYIVVSVVRDSAVFGEGSMPVTRQYMDDIKADVYLKFNK